MYLVTVQEERNLIEASLGGNVDALEIRVFGEELDEVLEGFDGQPYQILLDHSGAKLIEASAMTELGDLKDRWLATGAVRIVCVPRDERDREAHTTARIQTVLEGREEFVAQASEARFAAVGIADATVLRRAA